MFELADTVGQDNATIKVVGVGGGGGNAIANMVASNLDGVEFIVANTDAQALRRINVENKIQLGANITKGLGAGASPEVGRQSAEEDRDRIREVQAGADMVFITAGMGGGTGTGAAAVFAQEAKEQGILTVAVVTKPFEFEGKKRQQQADAGIEALSKHVDSVITIPNEKLLQVMGRKASLLDAFKRADDVLLNAVQGISELITRPGLINVDFADVRTVMSEMGMAVMGSAAATGDDRAEEAANHAISSPLLEDMDLSGAKGVLVNVTAGMDMAISEFESVGNVMREFASEDANVVMGTVLDPELSDELRVTVVATGLGEAKARAKPKASESQPAPVRQRRENAESLDTPTYLRRQREQGQGSQLDQDDLDIPAFLRKQAD
ncbi:cell division protein FtsZ [Thiohalorhabdus methylotrophus]|uniref:Cell division protein FtsZ n=1 Tax=Thiohalorhabdus methylotrophus TaxID=3242694 RepID=A0ABV4TXV3_9GAMM